MFVSRLHADVNNYQCFRQYYQQHRDMAYSFCAPVQHCLPPAVCYHTYQQFAGTEQPADARRCVTSRGKCFRFESKYQRGLERLWDFTIREIVFLGNARLVKESREAFMQKSLEYVRDLGLVGHCEVANDPFFIAPNTSDKLTAQTLLELKYELRLQIDQTRHIAIGSFNCHYDFFGRNFGIHFPDGTPIHTGCVGFGLERLAYAFVCQYGIDEKDWPSAIWRS
jgi:seryl-tRNA synthetase